MTITVFIMALMLRLPSGPTWPALRTGAPAHVKVVTSAGLTVQKKLVRG